MLSPSLPYAKPAVPARRARVTVFGRIFITVFVIAVFEGAARKWVSDSLTMPLILLRDLLVVYALYHAVRYSGFTPARRTVRMLLWWSAIVCFWGLLQLVAGINSLPIFLIGVRFWLLYLWFAYAAAELLEAQDLEAIYKAALAMLLFMAPLALVQHFQPPESFLNRQIEGDPDTVFRVTADVVRTSPLSSHSHSVPILRIAASASSLVVHWNVDFQERPMADELSSSSGMVRM